MLEEDWRTGFAKSLKVLLGHCGSAPVDPEDEARCAGDDRFLIMFNAHHEQLTFHFPASRWGKNWIKVLDTSWAVPEEARRIYKASEPLPVYARSLILLQRLV